MEKCVIRLNSHKIQPNIQCSYEFSQFSCPQKVLRSEGVSLHCSVHVHPLFLCFFFSFREKGFEEVFHRVEGV